MPDKVEFNMLGVDALNSKLKGVVYDVKRKGGRSALRQAAKLVANAAKQNAQAIDDPATARSIVDNIAIRWNGRMFKRTGDLGFRIGVAFGSLLRKAGQSDAAKSPTPHWRLLEFGSSIMKAKPFMRRALSDNIGAATSKFLIAYEKAIDKAIKKAAKGAKK